MKRFLMMMIGCVSLVSQGHAYYDNCGYCPPEHTTRCFKKCCDFQGWYVGGNVGWAFHDYTWVDRDAWVDHFGMDWTIGSACSTYDDVTVGLQTGYNYQCGCALLGLEIDASWADLQRSKLYSPIVLSDSGLIVRNDLVLNDRVDWFGTIRGRAGIISNNLLLFATAGAAWANFEQRWRMNDGGFSERFSSRRVRWGLALGVGVEWMLCKNLSFKAEGLCLKFPEHKVSVFSPNTGGTMHFDLLDDIWIARVGFNYKLYSLGSRF